MSNGQGAAPSGGSTVLPEECLDPVPFVELESFPGEPNGPDMWEVGSAGLYPIFEFHAAERQACSLGDCCGHVQDRYSRCWPPAYGPQKPGNGEAGRGEDRCAARRHHDRAQSRSRTRISSAGGCARVQCCHSAGRSGKSCWRGHGRKCGRSCWMSLTRASDHGQASGRPRRGLLNAVVRMVVDQDQFPCDSRFRQGGAHPVDERRNVGGLAKGRHDDGNRPAGLGPLHVRITIHSPAIPVGQRRDPAEPMEPGLSPLPCSSR